MRKYLKYTAPFLLVAMLVGGTVASAASNDWHMSYQNSGNSLVNADVAPSAYVTSFPANDITNGGPAFYHVDGVQLVLDDTAHVLNVGLIQPSQVDGLAGVLSGFTSQFTTDEAAATALASSVSSLSSTVSTVSGAAASLQFQMTSVASALASSTPQRTRVQTNTSGTYTWTFPTAYATGTVPVVEVTPEDSTSAASTDVRIVSVSNTSVTVQASRITTVLGLLSLNATPQIYVHISAMLPQ